MTLTGALTAEVVELAHSDRYKAVLTSSSSAAWPNKSNTALCSDTYYMQMPLL